MAADSTDLLEVLAAQGFAPPERWLDFARGNGVRRVPADKLLVCPDCHSPRRDKLGHYVHYSHLVQLVQCRDCTLVYSDTRFKPDLLGAHFEENYKDDNYFLTRRRAIFRQLIELIDRAAPPAGRVLDVGGATGHLMAATRQVRPDLDITLNDLSVAACQRASERGFATLCGGISSLRALPQPFDVVVMSDVIYYEPDIHALWQLLPQLVAPGGTLIIRVPNKLALIKIGQSVLAYCWPQRARMNHKIYLFNPEHLFIFPCEFLIKKLQSIGFPQVQALPAAPLLSDSPADRLLAPLLSTASRLIYTLARGRLVISPALVIVARRAGAC